MLKLSQLNCTIGNKQLVSIDQLDITSGKLFGLIGRNGSGKSSLVRVISGDLPSNGSIIFHDKPLKRWNLLEKAKHIGILPQASQLTFAFTAKEVVALGLTPLRLSRQEGKKHIQQHMKSTDCTHLANQPYPSLSGGERQRVQLARVLLQISQAELSPLLLLDEPTSSQDLGQQHSILKLAKALCKQQGYGILVILHDLNQVLRYCDFCALLDRGKIKKQGPPANLLSVSTVEDHWQYRPTLIKQENKPPILI